MKRNRFFLTLASTLCISGFSGYAAAVDGPVFTGIGDLPGDVFNSVAIAVSSDGNTVVGYSLSDSGLEAIRWSWDDGIEGLGYLPGGPNSSKAREVSADGSIIVGESYSAFKSEEGFAYAGMEAFRWTEEDGMVGLGDLPNAPFGSRADDVSVDGSIIVGTADKTLTEGPWQAGASEAFLWTEETGMVGLGDLPSGNVNSSAFAVSADGSVVVGFSGRPAEEAFRWTESTGMVGLGDLEGGNIFSSAQAVSADGDTVVGQSSSTLGPEAFRWTEVTGMVGLGDFPGGYYQSVATGVSGHGAVVVGHSRSDLGWEAFVWTELNGMQRLSEVLRNDFGLDLGGWTLNYAWNVSDDGLLIVGSGLNTEGDMEGWVVCLRDKCFEEGEDDDQEGGGHRHHDD